ncbi:MAG: GH32 C-terminal domain-containing protein [Candidatus Izemoplasmatales bacterium]
MMLKINQISHVNPMYKPLYHFSAPYGWLNDPNGFCYFHGTWHLFYQYNPKAARWGKMSWGHAQSKDLVTWTNLPIALRPNTKYERFLGCFSGSAIVREEMMWLMYTGVSYTKSQQLIAFSRDGIHFEKMAKPAINATNRPPFSGRMSFRDPKIFVVDNEIYAVIGAGYKCGRQIALYKSKNQWEFNFIGSIRSEGLRTMGIFECPDLIIGKKTDLLIYNVIDEKKTNNSIVKEHISFIEIGNANLNQGTFTATSMAVKIDSGADFYAPQTVISPDGRIILIAWMQSWGRTIPTAKLGHGWAGMMTIPREISIIDATLFQKPAKEIYAAFDSQKAKVDCFIKEEISFDTFSGSSFLLRIAISEESDFGVKIRKGNQCETIVRYEYGTVFVDRSHSGHAIKGKNGHDNGAIKACFIGKLTTVKMEIFVDMSSVEVFINDKYVLSSTIYPFSESESIVFYSKKGIHMQAELFHPKK